MPPRKIKEKSIISSSPIASTQEMKPVSSQERRFSSGVFVFGVLFVGAIVLAGYFYYQYSHTREVVEAKEIAGLIKKIGKVMDLPSNEVPTLATVTNKEKLDNQPFFKKAENGDKMLIYADAGRAILYRPSIEKIIDITSVTITDEEQSVTTPTEVAPVLEQKSEIIPIPTQADDSSVMEFTPDLSAMSATVALYNGSKKVGVTNTLETELIGMFENISINMKEKATRNDYVGNVIIDLSGQKTILAESLAEKIGGTVVDTPPSGETTPTDADILIIVGNK